METKRERWGTTRADIAEQMKEGLLFMGTVIGTLLFYTVGGLLGVLWIVGLATFLRWLGHILTVLTR